MRKIQNHRKPTKIINSLCGPALMSCEHPYNEDGSRTEHTSDTCYPRYLELSYEGPESPEPLTYREWRTVAEGCGHRACGC